MIELKEFQQQAAERIAERFRRHYEDPPMRGTQKNRRVVPFYQALSSITASGKTVILADAVSSIAAGLPVAPVVLWLSHGKVVVNQSYENLASGGKYHHLLAPSQVSMLGQYDATTVAESTDPLVFIATVGTFNQKDKEQGGLVIYRSEIDTAESSTWDALKARADEDAHRRPLLVVYDEAHNLSDQQTDLLMELEPDALILASATMRRPPRLEREVKHLEEEGWTRDDLVTEVDAGAVADSGLIKSTVLLAGYEAPMEETIDSLLSDMRETEDHARDHDAPLPKAIYVCKTNIVEGNSFQRDDPKRPFEEREAPPILIWRYLTERCGVEPADIAVYLTLRFVRDYPPPKGFRLFKGGENDYEEFASGEFGHVIFNLGLQEGWDDPRAYFAYVDKSMESNVQVEQVIGRLLRQPGATRYPSARLNTAHFYVRVDKRGVFNDLLEGVSRRLAAEAPAVKLVATASGSPKPESIPPKKAMDVFETGYDTALAVASVREVLDSLTDYRQDDGTNTRSQGGRALIQRVIGQTSDLSFQWEDFEHTNLVSARWLFQREVMRLFQGALGLAPTDAPKFDALVGFGSNAHTHIKKAAAEAVAAYLDNVVLKQKRLDPYEVGPTLVRRQKMVPFKNALHEGYSDLNDLERTFAEALDATGLVWCRNPSRTGYGIPLITIGSTSNFYPDFLVWRGDDVFALDTTGGHLLGEKTGRKLLSINPAKDEAGRLTVRFISSGHWNENLEREDPNGYTVWGLKQGGTLRASKVDAVKQAVERALATENV